MAKHVLRKQSGLRDPQIMHPEREWIVGILVALLIFFFCMFWSIYAYIENKNVSFEEANTSGTEEVVYRESLVKEALEIFAERKVVLDSLIGRGAPPPQVEVPVATTSEAVATSSEEISEAVASSTESE